jgi:hypothetical protein
MMQFRILVIFCVFTFSYYYVYNSLYYLGHNICSFMHLYVCKLSGGVYIEFFTLVIS